MKMRKYLLLLCILFYWNIAPNIFTLSLNVCKRTVITVYNAILLVQYAVAVSVVIGYIAFVKNKKSKHTVDIGSDNPLHRAVRNGDGRVPVSITASTYQNRRNAYGNTPLHLAIKYGNCSMVEAILSSKSTNPNIVDIFDHAPIDVAIKHNQHALVKKLINDPRVHLSATSLSLVQQYARAHDLNPEYNAYLDRTFPTADFRAAIVCNQLYYE